MRPIGRGLPGGTGRKVPSKRQDGRYVTQLGTEGLMCCLKTMWVGGAGGTVDLQRLRL